MPQIVSGLDPKVRLEAFLAGQQSQRALRQQQMAEAETQRAHQAEIMKAILGHHSQRAKALEDVNARAQMGEVMALQQQNLEAAAARKPMTQQRLEGLAEIGKGVTNPEARKMLQAEGMKMIEGMDKEEQSKAFLGMVDAAVTDGYLTPEEGELQKQSALSGKDVGQMSKDLIGRRDKADEEALNAQESAQALEQAQNTLAGLPPGSPAAKRVAKIIQKFSAAQTAQRQPGAGKKFTEEVLRGSALQGKAEIDAESARLGAGMTAEDPLPLPAFKGGTHATLRGTNRKGAQDPFAQGPIGYSTQLPPGQEIMDLFHGSKTADDFAKALNAAGIQKTPENKQFIAQLLQELSSGAAGQ